MWLAALILGLAGSLHCLGMCGPIALAVPVGSAATSQKLLGYGLYHFGRIAAYALLGFLFGVLGYGFQMASIQQGMSILAGSIMLLIIWAPRMMRFRSLEGPYYRWQSKIQAFMAARLRDQRAAAILGLGFFNGFLPCGMVYIALAGAIASYHPANGALFMTVFGLGTIPALLLLAFGGNALPQRYRLKLLRAAPIVASAIAILFIIRGLGLGLSFLSPEIGLLIGGDSACTP